MGMDFGAAYFVDLLPKSITHTHTHTYRFPSRLRYREFYPRVNDCGSIYSVSPVLLDRGRCVCLCVCGGLYVNTFPCSHPTVIIDKTLARLSPTRSMNSVHAAPRPMVALIKMRFFLKGDEKESPFRKSYFTDLY